MLSDAELDHVTRYVKRSLEQPRRARVARKRIDPSLLTGVGGLQNSGQINVVMIKGRKNLARWKAMIDERPKGGTCGWLNKMLDEVDAAISAFAGTDHEGQMKGSKTFTLIEGKKDAD